MERLNEAGLAGNCLVAKRVYTTDEDWSYDVVYPVAYAGVFDDM